MRIRESLSFLVTDAVTDRIRCPLFSHVCYRLRGLHRNSEINKNVNTLTIIAL